VLAPTFNAAFDQSATVIPAGTTVYFTDTSTTNGTPVIARGWQFGDGATASGSQASHVYPAAGRYTVTLTITDSCGYAATRVVPNAVDVHLPVLSVSKQAEGTLVEGLPITYTLTVVNSDSVAGATSVVVTDALPANASHVSGGSHAGGVVTLTIGTVPPSSQTSATWVVSTCQTSLVNQWYRVVTSTQGVASDWGQALALTIISPTITANFIAVPTPAYPNQSVTFTATATTNGLPIATYTWAFGDGGTGAGRVITHAYRQTGAYTVTLMAIDPCGFSAGTTINHAITVTQYKIYLPVIMRH
jgi:uncharacterized repeat protein (TIGR01451 family)